MNLGKARYRVDGKAMWQVLRIYAGDGALGRAVKSFMRRAKRDVCREKRKESRCDSGIETGLCDVAVAV